MEIIVLFSELKEGILIERSLFRQLMMLLSYHSSRLHVHIAIIASNKVTAVGAKMKSNWKYSVKK